MFHTTDRSGRNPAKAVTARSYLTAGIAALGVGAIALTSVQAVPDQMPSASAPVVSDLAVSLTAAVDPIQAWVNTFENSGANIEILNEFYNQKPLPLLQTIGANIATYIEELGNGNAGIIIEQIWGNIQKFFTAQYDPGVTVTWPVTCSTGPCPLTTGWIFDAADTGKPINSSGALPARNPFQTDDQGPLSPAGLLLAAGQLLAGVAEGGMPALANILDTTEAEAEELWLSVTAQQQLIDFVWTPASGQLMGFLGPAIAPLVQLTRSFTAIGAAFQAGEVLDAVYELINIPANMTNAFLNGLDPALDLGPLLKNFLPALGDGQVGVQLGGLLNSQPYNGSLQDADDPPTDYRVGALWNSLSVINWDIGDGFLMNNNPYGLKNGLFGSTVGMGQYLAEQLLVTPPEPPVAAAEPAAAKLAAPLDIPAPALTEDPADEAAPAVDAPAEEAAPAVVEKVAEVADVSEVAEPTVEDVADVEAAVEAAEASASEPAEAAAPTATGSSPKAAAAESDQSDGDTGRSASRSQRDAG